MKSSPIDLIAKSLGAGTLTRLAGHGVHEGIAEEAQPFVAAMLARATRRRTWIVCAGVRAQEDFAAELLQWEPSARLFPELPAFSGGEDVLLDPESASERLDILLSLADTAWTGPLVIHSEQLADEVPDAVGRGKLELKVGSILEPSELAGRLQEAGYERITTAAVRGQFAVRGGIVDVFSWQAVTPMRVEFDDRMVDSVRSFDPDTQGSLEDVGSCEIVMDTRGGKFRPLGSLVTPDDLLLVVGDAGCDRPCVRLLAGAGEGSSEFFPLPFEGFAVGDLVMDAVRGAQFFDQLEKWRRAKWRIFLATASEGEAERFRELVVEHGGVATGIQTLPLALARSFLHPASRTVILADAALFGRSANLRARRSAARRHRASMTRAATDFSEFSEGDTVVHLEHGIGEYEGLVDDPQGSGEQVLAIAYANDARLYVPISQAWQVSRYAGLGRAHPQLSELGSDKWGRTKEKAVASVFDYATRMLRVQAERESLEGFAFGDDTHWQEEFEDAFPYTETPDQVRAIAETKQDMEGTRPMDRLICGDVGFGKTEVAIRAIFKAIMAGKQAALLAPTTVLAQQHFDTLRERMSGYPATVELLNRYRTAAEQRNVIQGLADGSVDVVVGTHRLVSPDVVFRDIGLVVVDEEQRFGVRQKDLLKERFRQVDVLTLSATPIPRTLYMALVGTRDMSLMETPPPNRQPVETIVCAYDERVARDAILRELERGGQVYFLHNRVKTIERVASRIRELCPKAKVIVGHGQMAEGELDGVMTAFVAGDADVLVSTTIIESGLDIPNANTIVIDRADLFGLADLYQLRGRVGRSGVKAHAYLMLPRDLMGSARKRVSAIRQYSELGSGFKIAMRDLELRGAGNLLGTMQSGHIVAVGFDLYCRLLRRAAESLSGQKSFSRTDCPVHLDFVETEEAAWFRASGEKAPAFVPSAYVADTATRISCYRHLSECEDPAALDDLEAGWRDRFGPLPEAAVNALCLARIGMDAARRKLISVESRDGKLMLKSRNGFLQPEGRFPRLTESGPDSNLRAVALFVANLPVR